MAAAVQPLDTATEANEMLSLESDLQDAALDIDTPEWPGAETRDDDTDEAGELAKRATIIYFKNIPIPQSTVGGASPAPVELRGVRVDFLMARRKVREGRRIVLKSYCKSVRITNRGVKRRVTGIEIGTAGTRVTGKPFFEKIMPRNDAYVVNVAPDLILFRLTVAAAPPRGQ
ncbi:hypothetical protein E4U57_002069 [Claviceps arundinis]|uniref:Uncharacterized protein n=1 Tax=Claviceps arundinis TaxID=1623583 RepID=A0A9P7MXL2_9HYPO|nr:hypothetical protein E4U57_002069 [Claviceps arundinis]KAG5975704.1 hypothetical protein E4U56_003369 [Claviceps arundinis]